MRVRHGRTSGSGGCTSLSKLSSLEAVFSVSPTTTYSHRSVLPSVPETASPVTIPTRIPVTGRPAACQTWLSSSNRRSSARAHRTALTASRAISASVRRGTGTPKMATIESPAYWRMTPP